MGMSQQAAYFGKTFSEMLDPSMIMGKTQTNKNSEGTDMREFEAIFSSIYSEWMVSVLINLFKYEGLPDTVNWHFLEYLLRTQSGYAAIGKNSQGQLVVWDQIETPALNSYGDYSAGFGSGVWQTMYQKIVGKGPHQIFTNNPHEGDYAVVVNKFSWNGYVNRDVWTIAQYAKEMANIRALMHYNRQFQKTPIVMSGPKGALDNINMFDKIMGGDTYIGVSDKFDQSQINTIDLQVPLIQEQLKDAWNATLSEWLTMNGINTIGIDKKERLVKAEAEGNNQLTTASLDAFWEPRKQFIELLNERFGDEMGFHASVTINQGAIDALNQSIGMDQSTSIIDKSAREAEDAINS